MFLPDSIAWSRGNLSTGPVPFGFLFKTQDASPPRESLTVGTQQVPVLLVKNSRARRYVLRLQPDGAARVTIPRGGTLNEGWRFLERNTPWLEQQVQKLAARSKVDRRWLLGSELLFRGETVRIEPGVNDETGAIRFGTEVLWVADASADLRRRIEGHLWHLARKEFPPRVFDLAAKHQLPVQRVTVRNQRSRWGSCSRRGTISLNWRLIQTPPFVRDYIIYHELAHLREMNHSDRCWREVERLCPDYREAERWLRKHSSLIHRH